MKFKVGGDNRNGSVSVKIGTKGDSRDDSYNIDPSKRYSKFNRVLSERAGTGNAIVSATLDTSSEFIGYANNECDGLALKSKGTIVPPQDSAAVAQGIIQESIWMNIRIEQACKVHLTTTVASDLDIAEVMFQGPSFAAPVKIYDDYDKTLDITKPGEYSLRCGYQLSARFPNTGLGGRPIVCEIEARLTPEP
jgi:hypothetical protein